MKCYVCGAELADDCGECPFCHTLFKPSPPRKKTKKKGKSCPVCGAVLADNYDECPFCHTLFDAETRPKKAFENDNISFEFTPWADDEIVFVRGNWSIKRSHIDGLYDYTVDGIEASVPVDAFQLIEWGMARLKVYDALLPWDGAEITLEQGADVMRDLTDSNNALGDRKYITCEYGYFYYCNKYYLIKSGKAKPTEALTHILETGKTKLKKDDVVLWEDDKLVIVPRSGFTVEKGARAGMYRVLRGGIAYNYNAARIKDEGLGVDLTKYKIDSKAEYSGLNWRDYKKALGDFWMNERPSDIKTLRDVAVIWDGLKDPENSNIKHIAEYNGNISNALAELLARAESIKSDASKLNGKKAEYDAKVAEINEKLNEIGGKYQIRLDLYSDFRDFETQKKAFFAEVDALGAWRNDIQNLVMKEDEAYNAVLEAVGKLQKPFDIALLPQDGVTPEMRNDYQKSVQLPEKVRTEATSARKAFMDKADELLGLDTALTRLTDIVKSINENIKNKKKRKEDLDFFKRFHLSSVDYNKKPGIFCKPDKADHIRFTSDAKIKREKFGRYVVYGSGGKSLLVSRDELIYMGLAMIK